MRDIEKKRQPMAAEGGGNEHKPSSLDLIRMMGGRSRHVGRGPRRMPDSVIAVSRDRVTYTFIMENEVASIHFDSRRGEIFFSGHNIRNLKLSHAQTKALKAMTVVLAEDKAGKELLSAYSATLDRLLADK
ncbi:MAG: hypothetical protein JXA24_05825 [Proteobacteria bacterium]|nr:hypothetical protein [Pseudomonadota bacterium]